ncbi:MAG: pyruvate kinase [Dehalococcoidia bacterium]|nr:pyruvate kinase [Dehalococcoidia bacterium]
MNSSRLNRHVKIVCTLGPASRSPEVIESMLTAGMDVVRLNLNYGARDEHIQTISHVRAISQRLGLPTALLLDLPGLKKRPGATIREAFCEHLEFAREQNTDYIALSFISSAEQVREVKTLLDEMKFDAPLIVKIEKEPALADSEAILDTADGIMVARGDLAIQINIERVPLAQKRLIKSANRRGKPVITATEMLESMVESPTPTRAEATDVANAVLDGTDALMLSEESAMGKHPPLAVEMMAKIATAAETAFPHEERLREASLTSLPEINDATARAACQIARQINASAIIAFTSSGTTALRVAKYRPEQTIVAVTPSEAVMRRLSLVWGINPVSRNRPPNLEKAFDLAAEVALSAGVAKKGDRIVLTSGFPPGVAGSTNLVKVQVV